MNLAKAQSQHKEDIRQLEDHISKLDNNLRQAQARGTALEQEIARKEEQIKRNESEIKSLRTDMGNKAEEVRFGMFIRGSYSRETKTNFRREITLERMEQNLL